MRGPSGKGVQALCLEEEHRSMSYHDQQCSTIIWKNLSRESIIDRMIRRIFIAAYSQWLHIMSNALQARTIAFGGGEYEPTSHVTPNVVAVNPNVRTYQPKADNTTRQIKPYTSKPPPSPNPNRSPPTYISNPTQTQPFFLHRAPSRRCALPPSRNPDRLL